MGSAKDSGRARALRNVKPPERGEGVNLSEGLIRIKASSLTPLPLLMEKLI